MITKFIRKRNINTSLPFSKNFARVQVDGNTQTFKFTKKAVSSPGTDRLLTEAGDILNTESGNRLLIG
jgi:hypothetical protein